MRVCKKCGVEKPLSEFHESKVNKGGHKPICRDCYNWNHRSDESKKRELEWLDLFNKGLKKCACCGEVYELGKFPIRGESRDGHKSYCYECQRIKALNDSRKPETKKKKRRENLLLSFLCDFSNTEVIVKSTKYLKRGIKTPQNLRCGS